MVLLNRHIVFLDRLATNIRERTGTAIKRAEIIRALIDVLAESDLRSHERHVGGRAQSPAGRPAAVVRVPPTTRHSIKSVFTRIP